MSVRPSMRWAVPVACSGDMYRRGAGDEPLLAAARLASSRARPKSTSTGVRSAVRMMFAGLTSRWTMSRAWAWARASATAATIRAASGQAGRLVLQPAGRGRGRRGNRRRCRRAPRARRRRGPPRCRGGAAGRACRASCSARSGSAPLAGSAVQHLDGHGPVELAIVAEVHRAEAAGPQQTPHLIAAERRRDREGCRGGRGPALNVTDLHEWRALLALALEPLLRIAKI